MVDEQFGVYAKEAVEEFLVVLRLQCDVAHRVYAVSLQSLRYASAYAPEIRYRPV